MNSTNHDAPHYSFLQSPITFSLLDPATLSATCL